MRTHQRRVSLIILALLVLVLASACAGDGGSPVSSPPASEGTRNPGTTKRPKGAFTLASAVQLFKGAWTGPTLKVNKPGHPLNGLEIVDQGGSIPSGTQITISSSVVNSHSFGARFSKILSPMIVVEGTNQITRPILVRVPRPAGYGDDSDVVSVDPLEAFLVYETVGGVTAKFVDVVLRKIKVTGAAPRRGAQNGVVLVESSTPNSPAVIPEGRASVESASGFIPGQHDWPFVNWGSFASPGGDCTGMALTASYIYASSTGPTIRTDSRFTEDTLGFTGDDRDARRLCGKVQYDLGDAERLGLTNWYNSNLSTPLSPAKLIKAAKKRFADGVPLVLVLFSTTHEGGHAVVAFAAGANNLLLADPNFPGLFRHLTSNSAGTQWNPFGAQLDAGGPSNNYDLFYLVDPMKFADELEPLYQAALAGDVGADAFGGVSSYTIQDYCSKNYRVRGTDNLTIENPDIRFFPENIYQAGLQNQGTGAVEFRKFYFRQPGDTVELVTIKDSLQMVNLERGVFDPEDEECDFCTNMIPHRTKKPVETDIRMPLYVLVDTEYVWFDSINLKVKMKPMELDPAVAGGRKP